MDARLRTTAEERLLDSAAQLLLADPRPALRERLRFLRAAQPGAFDRAVAHYEQVVLPALAAAADAAAAAAAWVEYGGFVAGLAANCRILRIDADGRATAFRPPPRAAELVLALPEDLAADVLPILQPLQPSAAQSAAVALLVRRRLGLEDVTELPGQER